MLLICSTATLLVTWMFGARWLADQTLARPWARRIPATDPRARPASRRSSARLTAPALLFAVVAAVAIGPVSPSQAKGLGLPEAAPTTRVQPSQPGTLGASATPSARSAVAEVGPRDRAPAPATHAAGYAARESSAAAQGRFKGGDTTVVLGSSALVLILVIVLIVVLL
jgi:hypothetical protein